MSDKVNNDIVETILSSTADFFEKSLDDEAKKAFRELINNGQKPRVVRLLDHSLPGCKLQIIVGNGA